MSDILLKFETVKKEQIAANLIDIHNQLRSGRTDEARMGVEILLEKLMFQWQKHVTFPNPPKTS